MIMKTLLFASLLTLVSIPVMAQSYEPYCYIEDSRGIRQSLEYLCRGQSQATPTINQSLQLINVSRKQRMESGKFITVITGAIVNNSNSEINYPSLSYTTYRKNSTGLTEQESDKEFTRKVTLRPGESSNFEVKLTKNFDVFMVDYLDSVQTRNVDIKTCYAGGVESSGYCSLLAPLSIQRFN